MVRQCINYGSGVRVNNFYTEVQLGALDKDTFLVQLLAMTGGQ